jgi:TRAP-type C4-dicarboxylate transport system permease small subunit
MKMTRVVLLLLAVLVMLAACAPGMNQLARTGDSHGIVAGFWRGAWNGVIAPVTFVISLFNANVQMYEVHNNGGWYNLGFLLGMSVVFGGGAGGAASRRRRG